jgi:hypothetical protein
MQLEVKPEIKFGFLAAASAISLTLLQFGLGFHSTNFAFGYYSGYLLYAFLFVCLILNLREKKQDLKQDFNLRSGMRSALILLLISAGMSSVFMFIYNYHINPLWVENYVVWQTEQGKILSLSGYSTNDSALVLSNTETHLCLYFLGQMLSGLSMAFAISATMLVKRK